MSRIGSRIKCMRLLWSALLCASCTGCIAVPVHTTRIKGATGVETQKKVDLGFIHTGVTGREEVAQKLAWIDTGVKDDRFFVGRWADSTWGVAWAAAGYGNGAAGWNRHWTTKNLLLDFDDKGVVQRLSVFPDGDLIRTLSARVAQDPHHSLDLSKPIEIPIEYTRANRIFSGTLILGQDTFEFLEDREKHSKQYYAFKTSRENVVTLALDHEGYWNASRPGNLMETIHFKTKTAVGKQMTLVTDEPTLVVLIKYIACSLRRPARAPLSSQAQHAKRA